MRQKNEGRGVWKMADEQKKDVTQIREEMEAQYREEMEKREKSLVRCAVPERRSLLNALETLTKTELDDIRYNLCVQGISALKKKELAQALVPEIVGFAEKWFVSIGLEQYHILNIICRSGGVSTEVGKGDTRMDYMRCLGIVFSGSYEDKQAWYMPEELMEVYQKLGHVQFSEAVTLNDDVIRLTTGMLFYYGYLPYEVLYEKIKSYLPQCELSFIEFMGVLINAGCWQGNIVSTDSGMHYYTVIDPEVVYRAQMQRPELAYYAFRYAELHQAGERDYIEETDAFKALVGCFMQEFSLPVMEAVDTVGELLILLQNHPDDAMEEMQQYVRETLRSEDQKVTERVTAMLSELLRSTRRWALKGHCAAELQGDAPRRNVVSFVPRDAEVGRNDPCPCGSGKKYKKCCLDKAEQ